MLSTPTASWRMKLHRSNLQSQHQMEGKVFWWKKPKLFRLKMLLLRLNFLHLHRHPQVTLIFMESRGQVILIPCWLLSCLLLYKMLMPFLLCWEKKLPILMLKSSKQLKQSQLLQLLLSLDQDQQGDHLLLLESPTTTLFMSWQGWLLRHLHLVLLPLMMPNLVEVMFLPHPLVWCFTTTTIMAKKKVDIIITTGWKVRQLFPLFPNLNLQHLQPQLHLWRSCKHNFDKMSKSSWMKISIPWTFLDVSENFFLCITLDRDCLQSMSWVCLREQSPNCYRNPNHGINWLRREGIPTERCMPGLLTKPVFTSWSLWSREKERTRHLNRMTQQLKREFRRFSVKHREQWLLPEPMDATLILLSWTWDQDHWWWMERLLQLPS